MSNKPTHTAFQVTKAGDKNFWNRIGAAWENKEVARISL